MLEWFCQDYLGIYGDSTVQDKLNSLSQEGWNIVSVTTTWGEEYFTKSILANREKKVQ